MRVKSDEFEHRLKKSLAEKPALPDALEAALFERAEGLLAGRRERVFKREEREAESRHAAQARRRKVAEARGWAARAIELLAIHPDAPAAAAALTALVAAFLLLHRGGGAGVSRRELVDKFIDNPERYEAQVLADRQAYEREVEDAHQKSSGGI